VIAIERAITATDDVRALIGELDATLAAGYAPEQRHGLALDALFAPHVRFFIARVAGVATGCCGVAFDDGFAEVKRMYVRPHARGTGFAAALLAHVEAEASAQGYTLIRLETGNAQHAAMRFYERAGYERCPVFGAYASMPPETIVTSVFMEKRLGRG
jgi:putative acetyltransferase